MNNQKTFRNDNSKIYLVGTPIGNIDDISLRAIKVLKMVSTIYCEDTRNTLNLLKQLKIENKLKSYHLFNENEITDSLINQVKNGENIAVVSDAGMPIISDPGYVACQKAIEAGIDVVVIPGPSAFTTALVASGIPANHFTFYGFLNSRKTKRIAELESLKYEQNTLIFYEAPHRIKDTLEDILAIFGDRYICLARELTKTYEEYLRGKVSEVLNEVDRLKGEMVLIVSGSKEIKVDQNLISLSLEEHYQLYLSQGLKPKDAMKKMAIDRDTSANEIYKELKIK